MNEAVHSVMKFSPKELWSGTNAMCELAFERTRQERAYRNRHRVIVPAQFLEGDIVLAQDQEGGSNRFAPS